MSEREEVVLCGASAYNKKFYLNQDFRGLPDSIKDELKIMCVLFSPFAWLRIFSFYATTDGTPCAPSVLINFSDFIYDLLQFP